MIAHFWRDGGFMMWPLALAALIGLIIIVWKLFDLSTTSLRTRRFLREVDELIAQRKINEALALSRDSNTPAGRILAAGLERHHEGSMSAS
jgi:biopolymer transport protein ExbB